MLVYEVEFGDGYVCRENEICFDDAIKSAVEHHSQDRRFSPDRGCHPECGCRKKWDTPTRVEVVIEGVGAMGDVNDLFNKLTKNIGNGLRHTTHIHIDEVKFIKSQLKSFVLKIEELKTLIVGKNCNIAEKSSLIETQRNTIKRLQSDQEELTNLLNVKVELIGIQKERMEKLSGKINNLQDQITSITLASGSKSARIETQRIIIADQEKQIKEIVSLIENWKPK